MKTVKDTCTLQPNALDIKLSDQVEQLDALIKAEGTGDDFFAKTFLTQGMTDLVSGGLARLAGKSSQAIFHLKQAMGGGKTHLLVGLGLVATQPDLRRRVCAGMPHLDAFGVARVAAFNGRNTPEQFFWGEIAAQLGQAERFRKFWTAAPQAPDENDWLALFGAVNEPTLVLLDELPPYFHYLDSLSGGNSALANIATRAFANMLSAAGKKQNVCVVISDLTAAYDTGSRLIYKALDDARAELGRQERSITPVDLTTDEMFAILRKRLFVQVADAATIDDVAAQYGRKLEEATRSKTANRGAEAVADEIASSYPFHPEPLIP